MISDMIPAFLHELYIVFPERFIELFIKLCFDDRHIYDLRCISVYLSNTNPKMEFNYIFIIA